VTVYNVDEKLTPVLLTSMHTCFVSFAGVGLVLGLGLVTSGLHYSTGSLLCLFTLT